MSEMVKCYRKHQTQSKKQHLNVIHAGSRSATIYSYEFLKSNGLTTLDNISGMNPMHLFIYFHGWAHAIVSLVFTLCLYLPSGPAAPVACGPFSLDKTLPAVSMETFLDPPQNTCKHTPQITKRKNIKHSSMYQWRTPQNRQITNR